MWIQNVDCLAMMYISVCGLDKVVFSQPKDGHSVLIWIGVHVYMPLCMFDRSITAKMNCCFNTILCYIGGIHVLGCCRK